MSAEQLRSIEEQIARLQTQADALRREQQQQEDVGEGDGAAEAGPARDAAELAATRDYARSVRDHSPAEVVAGCARALRLYGFCVIDRVVPEQDVPRVRDEIVEATERIPANKKAADEGEPGAIVRPTRFGLPGNEPCHQVLFLPQLAEYLAHDAVAGVAREALDDHIRLAQFNTRPIRADNPDEGISWNRGQPGFGTAGKRRGRDPGFREWHTVRRPSSPARPRCLLVPTPLPTLAQCALPALLLQDWPHMVHGGSGPDRPPAGHMGSIRKRQGQPFVDVPMCLSCVWCKPRALRRPFARECLANHQSIAV